MDEPTFPLRRDAVELNKCHVSSGDELILQSNLETKPEDRLQVNIHMTLTGQPDDSQYIDKIEVSQQYTLRDLKDVILTMKQFEFAQAYVSSLLFLYINIASGINQSEREIEKHVPRENYQGLIRRIDTQAVKNQCKFLTSYLSTSRARIPSAKYNDIASMQALDS